jgi:hypothetical protein
MNNLKYILIIISFCIACSRNNKNNPNCFYPTSNTISLENPVDSLLQIFIEENKGASQYLLITYLSDDQRIVTFIANSFGDNYIKGKKPLFYFVKNDRRVYLITGIEDLFKVDFSHWKETKQEKKPYSKIKSYVISKDRIELIPKGIPPFAPPPSAKVERKIDTKTGIN